MHSLQAKMGPKWRGHFLLQDVHANPIFSRSNALIYGMLTAQSERHMPMPLNFKVMEPDSKCLALFLAKN